MVCLRLCDCNFFIISEFSLISNFINFINYLLISKHFSNALVRTCTLHLPVSDQQVVIFFDVGFLFKNICPMHCDPN